MTNHNRNFAFAYVFLVMLPVVGLVSLLRAGRALVAPVSVNGSWKTQANASAVTTLPCSLTASSQTLGWVIAQSGKNFTLNLAGNPQPMGAGQIEGTAVSAIVPLSASAGCNGKSLKLMAKVDPNSIPRVMDGTLNVIDCPACASLAFHATQEDPAKAKGGH